MRYPQAYIRPGETFAQSNERLRETYAEFARFAKMLSAQGVDAEVHDQPVCVIANAGGVKIMLISGRTKGFRTEAYREVPRKQLEEHYSDTLIGGQADLVGLVVKYR